MKHHFQHHWILGYHSTWVSELPEGEQVIAVYGKEYWRTISASLGRLGQKLKPSTKLFSFIALRVDLPNFVGEGATMDEAVDDLLTQLVEMLAKEAHHGS